MPFSSLAPRWARTRPTSACWARLWARWAEQTSIWTWGTPSATPLTCSMTPGQRLISSVTEETILRAPETVNPRGAGAGQAHEVVVGFTRAPWLESRGRVRSGEPARRGRGDAVRGEGNGRGLDRPRSCSGAMDWGWYSWSGTADAHLPPRRG